MGAHTPERTCCACREKGGRDELIRLVLAPDGRVVVDLRGKLPGRGAWVHPRPGCLDALTGKRQPLRRAFKSPVDADGVADQLRELVVTALGHGISMAAAGGGLVGGREALERGLREGQVDQVILAHDGAERTIKALRRATPEGVAITMVPYSASELGGLVGRASRAGLGVKRCPASRHLVLQLRRFRSLG